MDPDALVCSRGADGEGSLKPSLSGVLRSGDSPSAGAGRSRPRKGVPLIRSSWCRRGFALYRVCVKIRVERGRSLGGRGEGHRDRWLRVSSAYPWRGGSLECS